MNILIISADFPPWDGGIAQVGYEYARALSAGGHNVTVLAPVYGDDAQWDRRQSFEVLRYRSHKAFVVHFWLLRIKLTVLLQRSAFDWILCMRWNLDGIALGAKTRNQPVVFQWYHGSELFDRHLSNTAWAGKLSDLMGRTAANIAVSNYTAGLLAHYYPDCPRVHTIHLGIDSRRFEPPISVDQAKAALGLNGKRVILSLARLVKRKGQDTVIKSLVHLNNLQDIVYVIAGKGSYENSLVELVNRLGLEEHVRFVGFVPEEQKVEYYQACDIYVMPSRSDENSRDVEGFGLTYLEANACGKPVIGGRQGGCQEAIADGISGLLVDPDNDLELAAALKRLLQDQTYYSQLSQQGLERARKEFSWKKSCDRLIALYESCTHPNREMS
jgi:phosphatidylinositol alpha-1,6-mannosyltransferase